MEPTIRFEWNGVQYAVSMEAYDTPLIVLPDGTVLQVTSWFETSPPRIVSLNEVNHLFKDFDVEYIAEQMNGVVARLA
jgi:hypothetical protein